MGTLALHGVTARYGRTPALHGIDLELADGEFFVLLGPSGAGKTTTLKCVAGLLDGAGGQVVIGGRDMTGVEPYDRGVAMAFESYALYPQKTVAENLASPLRSGRCGTWTPAEQQARVKDVTTTLGIDHLLGRYPRELSNGQRQRTALGRVLVRPAEVYLLDEPLSHLDAKLRAAMRAELAQIGETMRTTTLYVTHDYQEALALGDRIGVLRDGRLVQVGTPSEIWTAPVDTFVARALGQPEMNLIDAPVHDGIARFAGVEVGVPDGSGELVRIGIRPRDIELRPSRDQLVLRGRVRLAERLGRSVELTLDVAGTPLIVVTDERVAEGSDVEVGVDRAKVHVFGADATRIGAARATTGATRVGGGAR
jgi:multiple sugar transport system ATP-binding protein